MAYIISILIGYTFGIFNVAYIIARTKGFDIRTRGTKNPGASNATIIMGWRIGILVGVCDILKGVAAVYAAKFLFPDTALVGVLAGVSSVFGHMFPFYLRFRGGKGFATYLGMILMLNWKFFLIIGVAIVVITLVTDYIVIGTLVTVVSFPLFSFLTNLGWMFAVIVAAASLIIIIKHSQNFVRIVKGEEIGLLSTFKRKS